MAKLQSIKLSEIRENKVALRAVDVKTEDFRGLVDSIRERGVLNAISVRQRSEEDGTPFFELVDGLHRFTAAQEAGLTEIPAQILDLKDQEVMEAQLLANVHKIETKPVEYSKHIQRILANSPTMTINDLASKLCKSPGWLGERLGLLKLDNSVAKLVDEGKVNLSNAYALAKLPVEDQFDFLTKAQTLPPQEFVPAANARVKEIREARRTGKDSAKAEFVAVPYLQKLAILKQELNAPTIIPSLLKQYKINSVNDAALFTLKWVLHVDPMSIDAARQKEEASMKEQEDAKKKRAVERAQKKAEEAAKIAAKAAEEAGIA